MMVADLAFMTIIVSMKRNGTPRVDALEKIIDKERPDALLPTLGGQTGLNLSMDLNAAGILEKYGVQMIGANPAAIEKGEAREIFKQAMLKIGLDVARSATVNNLGDAARDFQTLFSPRRRECPRIWSADASVCYVGDSRRPRGPALSPAKSSIWRK